MGDQPMGDDITVTSPIPDSTETCKITLPNNGRCYGRSLSSPTKPFSKDNNPTKTTTNEGLPKLTLFSASDLKGITA
tara:strand:- start:145 stop:375 length:231 start_codon:yes stop_codon:yes gene_type:complete